MDTTVFGYIDYTKIQNFSFGLEELCSNDKLYT